MFSKSDSDLAQLEWTDEEEARIRHKIDWHTVPLVTALYLLCVRSGWLYSSHLPSQLVIHIGLACMEI
jgi:hypothetical protein